MRALELFAGAGGLAMGLARAGFVHAGLVEFNHHACETMRFNGTTPSGPLRGWRIVESDTRHITDFAREFGGVDMVAGGPPCQPFSMGGKAKGPRDARDMFPEAVRAARQMQPMGFIFENVKGLLRGCFRDYFEYIVLQLTYPTLTRRPSESWEDHRTRLKRTQAQGSGPDLQYRVTWALINAADYGIPQRRERVFLVGFRSDLKISWTFPKPTHSRAALDWAKFETGEYFDRHQLRRERRIAPRGSASPDLGLRIEPSTLPWVTVRDAIGDLPNPNDDPRPDIDHVPIPGARAYPGHTGSPIDEPAKTLKAGDHGVPGGENMLAHSNGRVRYFTLREAARLQTFPDEYRFNRCWTESMRQVGNAVPVELGRIVAESVVGALRTPAPSDRLEAPRAGRPDLVMGGAF